MRMKFPVVLGVVVFSACAAVPPPDDALDKARAAVRAAQSDPKVGQYAPAELDLATEALRDGRGYIALQRARIARELASARSFDAERSQRERAELEQRIRGVEAERDRALARAVAAERSRDDQDRLAAEVRRLKAQVAQLEAEKTERGWILTLGSDLLFDVGQAKLKPGGRQAIANVARFMRERGERKVVVEGFTDNTGSPAFNQRLSERRALAVRDALVKQGIDADQIEARGLGPANPVASNDHPSGRSLNRRVEIVIGEDVGRAATGGSKPRP